MAVGIDGISRKSVAAAAVTFFIIVGVCGVQQVQWFQRLVPDTKSADAIACLRAAGARGALADYWMSYKLTFLTDEGLIVAPGNAFDRYPAYTGFVQSLGLADTQPCHSLLLQ
jgi:hypothetical protein